MMEVSAERGVVLRGGPRDVVITAQGAAVVPPEAVDLMRRTPAVAEPAQLHRQLVTHCGVGPGIATRAVARLLDVSVIGYEGKAPVPLTVLDLEWDRFAMLPEIVGAIAHASLRQGRTVAVEFGSGVSTVALAAAASVAQEPMSITSFEQDPTWWLRLRGALDVVSAEGGSLQLVACPLVAWPGPAPLPVSRWYDRQAVVEVLASLPGPVDLLVVDGPTAFREAWRFDRYPALPAIRPFLARGARIMLDDTHRPSEQAVLQQWQQELGVGWRTHRLGRGSWLVNDD